MNRRTLISLLFMTLWVVYCSCGSTSRLTWRGVPVDGENLRFDGKRGILIVEMTELTVGFTPLPMLNRAGELFEGELTVTNRSRGYITVLWEAVDLSDSYGFFKTYRFGQKQRVPVSFPTENAVISSGNVWESTFSVRQGSHENAAELMGQSTYTLILPVRISDRGEPVIIEADYTISEMK